MKKKRKLTLVSILHYFRLLYRSALFIALVVFFIREHIINHNDESLFLIKSNSILMNCIWGLFIVEMIIRFFPSKFESPGCQKQFKRNYKKTGETAIEIEDNHGVAFVGLIWLSFNLIIGALCLSGIIVGDVMLLLACFYSVCDVICILFFCPFQTFLFHNKCCSTCRIYNWDYAMMFTPLFFVMHWYTWSLLAVAIILLFRWEITFYKHPERFSPKTNGYLACENCNEKLCYHKKQLQYVWRKTNDFVKRKIKSLEKKDD